MGHFLAVWELLGIPLAFTFAFCFSPFFYLCCIWSILGGGLSRCTAYKTVSECPPDKQELLISNSLIADYTCQPCGCQSGQTMVVKSGQNISSPCSNGLPYFACMNDTQLLSWATLRDDQRMSYTFNSSGANQNNAVNGFDAITIETCDKRLLPKWSNWIGYSTPDHIAKRCYFSCKYGLGAGAADLRQSIALSMQSYYESDMYTVRKSSAFKTTVNSNVRLPRSWLKGVIFSTADAWGNQKATWADLLNSRIANKNDKEVHDSVITSDDYSRLNTFLFVDSILSQTNLNDICLPPKNISDQACQSDWHSADAFSHWKPLDRVKAIPYECAWNAVKYGITRVCLSLDDCSKYGYAVLMPDPFNADTKIAACTASEIALTSGNTTVIGIGTWSYGCYQSRVDTMSDLVTNAPYSLSTRSIFFALEPWIQPSTWKDPPLEMNPYLFDGDGILRCVGQKTFKASVQSLLPDKARLFPSQYNTTAACVPCSILQEDGNSLCSTMLGPGYNFIASICTSTNVNTTIGLREVCQKCPSPADANLLSPTNTDYRNMWNQVQNTITHTDQWICRYSCNSGYYMNTQGSYAIYQNAPCLPCPSASLYNCSGNEYFDNTITMCPGGIQTYTRPCKPCAATNASLDRQLKWPSSGSGASSNSECLGLCDPQYYHTVLVNGGGYTNANTAVSQYKIANCEPCSQNTLIPCNGGCSSGHYLNVLNGTCPICNVSSCPLSKYRTNCSLGATQDTSCADCDANWLNNRDTSLLITSDLKMSLITTSGVVAKRWIPYQSSYDSLTDLQLMQQFSLLRISKPDALNGISNCYLTCRNNYVWIDATPAPSNMPPEYNNFGRHPLNFANVHGMGNQANFVCVPCMSAYITSFLKPNPDTLYSVWNAIGPINPVPISIISPVQDMIGYNGTCYSCQKSDRDVTDSSDVFCELSIGHGVQNAMASIQTFLIEAVNPNSQLSIHVVNNVPLTAQSNSGLAPVLGIEYVNYCCGKVNNSDLQRMCYKMKSLAIYNGFLRSVNVLHNTNFTTSMCATNVTFNASSWLDYTITNLNSFRRLLQAPPAATTRTGACLNGQYKRSRGDSACIQCVDGASTTYPWYRFCPIRFTPFVTPFVICRDKNCFSVVLPNILTII